MYVCMYVCMHACMYVQILALHVGCVGLGPSDAFVAWGFADDCLRIATTTPNTEQGGGNSGIAPERKVGR